MKKIHNLLPVFLLGLLYSCVVPYQVTTTFNEKGEVRKDIYTASSIQQKTNTMDLEPFPFISPDDWDIHFIDTFFFYYAGKPYPLNVKASQCFSSLKEVQGTALKQSMQEFFAPQEQFKKQFRWFYTYYTYEARFPEAVNKGKIPVENYLDQDEIDIWFAGKNKEAFFKGMNGMEINQILQNIEDKFLYWIKQNQFEVICDVLESQLQINGLTEELSQLKAINRGEVFHKYFSRKSYLQTEETDISVGVVAGLIDKEFSTKAFSQIYLLHKKEFEEEVDEWWNRIEPAESIMLKYEVVLPGKLIQTNTDIIEAGIPFWRINLSSFLTEDCILTAQSRTANIWAFLLTFLFVGIVVWGIVWKNRSGR